MLSVAASTATALTVVEPTSIPTRSCGVIALPRRRQIDVPRRTREAEESAPPIHQVAHVQREVRRRAGHPGAMRHLVERVPQLRMLRDEVADVFEPLPGGFERLAEFRLGLGLGLAERHLHTAVRVDLAFARGL